jgi:hypothetical protein
MKPGPLLPLCYLRYLLFQFLFEQEHAEVAEEKPVAFGRTWRLRKE